MADDTRRARNANWEKECSPKLTKLTKLTQLTKLTYQTYQTSSSGFFWRLSARQRLIGQKEFTRDIVIDDLDEESEEDYASRQDENVFDKIHDAGRV